jgi:Sulfotransferase domain
MVESRDSNRPGLTRNSARAYSFGRRKVERVDFIVAGVQKAGTTALHDFLAQHPHVALLRDQALHFFDQEGHFPTDGLSRPDYRILHGHFRPGWRWKIAGEVTADYLYYPHALERIAQYNAEMKLIISLRDPTERAFSQWNMRRAKGQEPLEFIDAIKRDQDAGIWRGPRGNAYIARSLYSEQLGRVFELFPRDQVLLIKYEELGKDPSHTVATMFDFLGVARRQVKNKRRNVGSYSRQITTEEREHVSAIFDEEISKIESLLGWNCSDWRHATTVARY